MVTVGIGMLGAGFIGQMHSLTFGSIGVSKHKPQLSGELITLADTNLALAEEVQQRYGWENISADWHEAVDDDPHPHLHQFRAERRPCRTNHCRGAAWQGSVLGETAGADR